MLNGNQLAKITITEELVKRALDSLIQLEDETPLEYLLCVEQRIIDEDIVRTAYAHRIALQDILIELIETNISQRLQRKSRITETDIANLSTIADVTFAIDLATKRGDSALLGLLWLYCHYAKSEFDFPQSEFAQLVGVDSRTVRRYQRRAIQLVTEQLSRFEVTCWKQYRYLLLTQNLPHKGRAIQFGRDSELRWAIDYLQRAKPKHLLITGVHGVGKSSFAEKLAVMLLESQLIEHLIWISHPGAIETVRDIIFQELSITRAELAIPLPAKTLLIIDGVDHLNKDDFVTFLNEAHTCLIIMTGMNKLQELEYGLITLESLPSDTVQLYLEFAKNYSYTEASESIFAVLQREWIKVGGNPLALQKLIANLSVDSYHDPILQTARDIYGNAISSLSPRELVSLCLALFVPDMAYYNELIGRYQKNLQTPLSSGSDLSNSTRIYEQYSSDPSMAFQRLIVHILAERPEIWEDLRKIIHFVIREQHERGDLISIVVIERALAFAQNTGKYNWYSDVAKSVWTLAIKLGRWPQWYAILKNARQYELENDELLLGLATCMRLLHKHEAGELLLFAIQRYGSLGKFALQSEARLQYAMFLRNFGYYDQAKHLLSLLRTSEHLHHGTLFSNRVATERVLLLMESGHRDIADEMLSTLDGQDPRVLLLQLEISLYLQDRERVRQLARLLLSNSSTGNETIARVHILLGLFEQKRNAKSGLEHFIIAYSVLCRGKYNRFHAMRILSNIGALLLELGRKEEANEILAEVEFNQLQLQDRMGLAVTKHNVRALMENWLFDKSVS
jgi:hypothetical protein